MLLLADGIIAQPAKLYFSHLTADDGLSQGVVNDILVDKKGFAWFTTYDGINRFDGTRCISNEQIGPGLEGISMTRGLVEDKQGNIWFGSEGALIQYSYKTNHFSKLLIPQNQDGSPTKLSFYHPRAAQGDILLIEGGYGVKYLYNVPQNTWRRISNLEDPDNGPMESWKLPAEANWFSSHLMLVRSNDDKHSFFRLKSGPGAASQWQEQKLVVPGFHHSGIHYPLNDSVLLIMTNEHALWSYHFSGNRLEKLHQFNIQVSNAGLFADKNNRLWILTQHNGILVFDLIKHHVNRHYQYDETSEFSLLNTQISSFNISDNGILWVSSWGKGLNFCRLNENGFSHLFTSKDAKANNTDNYIRGIVQGADGHFYCNTQFGGLVELGEDLSFIKTISKDLSNTLATNPSKTKLYFGQGELYSYDIITKKITRAINGDTSVSGGGLNVYYFFSPFHRGGMLASTLEGVWLINEAGNVFSALPGLNDIGYMQSIFCYEDSHGLIYKYSISHGLQLFKQIKGRYELIYSFPVKFIAKYVLEENNSSAWIATTNGLYLFDPIRLNILKHYTVANGLPNNVIYALADDGMGNLWMSTNKGLSVLNKATALFKNYAGAGMQGNEYNSHTVVTARDGRIIFGGVNGLTVIRPREIKTDSLVPHVQFTAIRADSSINPFQFQASDTLLLDPGSNTVEFSFAAIEFINPKGCSLKYRLKGYDKDWVFTGNPGNARYVKLPPGKYTFEVVASNADGVWGNEVRQLEVHIAAWWWQKWWFTVLSVAVSLIIIFLLLRQYVKQKLYRQRVSMEQQLAIAKERERIITDLHDDVGATLSSMHIYGDLANATYDSQPLESRKMMEKISSTSRELMSKMGDIIWSMKPAGEESHSFEARLKNYSNELLNPKNILCDFDIDHTLDTGITDPEARKAILLICKEAINNIAKYSEASKATVLLKQEQGKAVLHISDDGKGFNSARPASGNGLANMKKRCDQLGGEFSVVSMPGKGVSITCRFSIEHIQ